MEKFCNKIAIVTGSSSGIGYAISRELVKHGLIVVGLARRMENLQKLADELNEPDKTPKFYPVKCDISVESEIEKSFKWITSELGAISVLINNAGIARGSLLTAVNGEDISQIFDTNVKAPMLWAKLAIQSMQSDSIQGHIININSLIGHEMFNMDKLNLHQVYVASKRALKAFSESLRRELVVQNSDIKITNLSPGLVVTEINRQYAESLPPKRTLQPKDIADACVYVLSTPSNVLVSELTIMPINQNV